MMNDAVAAADAVPGHCHDGITARQHAVEVGWDSEGLILSGEGGLERVAWAALRRLDTFPEAILIGRSDRPGWRLRIAPDAPAGLLAGLPPQPRFGGWIDRIGFFRSLAICALLSGLVGYVAVNTPGWLGRRVPMAWEAGMSDDGFEDLAASTCHTPASDAALARLVASLDRENRDGHLPPIRIELIKFGAVNAVALPGGRVLVFDGLVGAIRSPDTLAGVVGHEIGHVRERHVMQAMLREFGISMVLSGLKSGVTNTLGTMTALRYSREAETEADDWARARLAEARISPQPTAEFFTALAAADEESGPALATYLNSHPDPLGRGMAFRAAYRSDAHYRPALDPTDFAAIRSACEDDRRVRPLRP